MDDAKAGLRETCLAARRERPAGDIELARSAIRAHVLARCAIEGWTCVAGYEPLRTEPGSLELLAALVGAGVRVLVPITLTDRDLDWREWPSGSALGVDALAAADLVLVPALAVSPDGTRLGRGGGSYDRALLRNAGRRVALLFDGEVIASVPRAAWDVPVSAVVTPAGWRDLGCEEPR